MSQPVDMNDVSQVLREGIIKMKLGVNPMLNLKGESYGDTPVMSLSMGLAVHLLSGISAETKAQIHQSGDVVAADILKEARDKHGFKNHD